MMTSVRLLLASQSPRRKALLESAGITTIVLPPAADIDAEALEAPLAHEAPLAYVQRVASLKRDLAIKRLQSLKLDPAPQAHDLVLAADTTVELDGRILGKPADPQKAHEMLHALSGKWHQVHTAISMCRADGSHSDSRIVSAQVRFAPLSDAWITGYIASGEPMDKAGAYGIQGRAGAMIPEISGSYTAIVGLPLFETLQMMHALSADTSDPIR